MDVVLSAPGYEELRLPVMLRETELYLYSNSGTSTVNLRVGEGTSYSVSLLVPGSFYKMPRAGISITAEFSATPEGFFSLDPARVSLTSQRPEGSVSIRGTAGGGALVRMTSPDGLAVRGSPVAVTVHP